MADIICEQPLTTRSYGKINLFFKDFYSIISVCLSVCCLCPKTEMSVLAKQPTVHSGGSYQGGSVAVAIGIGDR